MILENVCTLPLSADVFAIALHPSRPLLTVGLASGHAETFRLPENSHSSTSSDDDASASVLSDGRATIDTTWRTRRHKGSCRAVEFSPDGEYAYSAGTDGLVKHFSSETGQVVSKIWVPRRSASATIDKPSLMHVLNPQCLLLATDGGALHVFDLRSPHGTPAQRPKQTHTPHSDYVTGIAPLQPTAASTSGFAKQWVSVGGTTLAVTDMRRGVMVRSEDQEDELLCARFVKGVGPKGKQDNGVVAVGSGSGVVTIWDRGVWDDQTERIVVDKGSGSNGKKGMLGLGGGGGESIDAMAVVPEDASWGNGGRRMVVGMGDGTLRVVDAQERTVGEIMRHDEVEGVVGVGFDGLGRLISAGGSTVKVWEESVAPAKHESDEDASSEEETPKKSKSRVKFGNPQAEGKAAKSTTEAESASAPAKGKKRPAPESSDEDSSEEEDSDEDEDDDEDDSDDDDDDDSGDSSEDEAQKQREMARERKEAAKKARLGPMGAHGILAFDGMD